MFCKWCGLESDTSDRCSWCRQPFTSSGPSPDPASSAPPSPAPPGPAASESFDDFDDDLSPIPFIAAPSRPQPKPISTPPPAVPEPPRPTAPPPGPPGYRPVEAEPVKDRPDLQAIPIKRGGDSPAPPVIPVARPQPQPSPPPPAASQAAPIPLAGPHAPAAPPPKEVEPEKPPAPADRKVIPLGDAQEELPPPPSVGRIDLTGAPAPVTATPRPESAPRPSAPPAATAATATRARRGYYCRWCGMESEAPDRCTWCRKDLKALPAVRQPSQDRRAPQQPAARTRPQPEANGNGPAAVPNVPQLGTFTAVQSKYYDKVVDPISGAHYDADSGQAEGVLPPEAPIELVELNQWNQLAKNVALLVSLAFIVAVVGRAQPGWYLVLLGLSNFIGGMAMPLLRTVEFGEDDSGANVATAIALILILGPFVGFILYLFICIVQQDFSPAIIGIFLTYLVLRFTLDAVVGMPFLNIMPWKEFSMQTIGAQIAPFATMAGWYAASIFRKPDE